jgi:hypothetical protein
MACARANVGQPLCSDVFGYSIGGTKLTNQQRQQVQAYFGGTEEEALQAAAGTGIITLPDCYVLNADVVTALQGFGMVDFSHTGPLHGTYMDSVFSHFWSNMGISFDVEALIAYLASSYGALRCNSVY